MSANNSTSVVPAAGRQHVRIYYDLIRDERFARLSGSAVKLLIALLSFADRTGKAWPRMKLLAARAGMSMRSAFDCATELEAAGLLVRRRSPGRMTEYLVQPVAHPPPRKTAQPPRQIPQPTHAAECRHGTSSSEPTPINQVLSAAPQWTRRVCFSTPGDGVPRHTPRNQVLSAAPQWTKPAPAISAYRPEPAWVRESRERRYRGEQQRRLAERQAAQNQQEQLQRTLASLPPERLRRLKEQVVAELPPFLRDKLKDKDPLLSPTLGAFIIGRLACDEADCQPSAASATDSVSLSPSGKFNTLQGCGLPP